MLKIDIVILNWSHVLKKKLKCYFLPYCPTLLVFQQIPGILVSVPDIIGIDGSMKNL